MVCRKTLVCKVMRCLLPVAIWACIVLLKPGLAWAQPLSPEPEAEWRQNLQLKSLSIAKAETLVLRQFGDDSIFLPSLESLPPDVAAVLARNRHDLIIGVPVISAEAAVALARHEGGPSQTGLRGNNDLLALPRLIQLPAEVAEALSARRAGSLEIASLRKPIERISDDAAVALSQYRGERLSVSVEHLSPKAQEALSRYKGDLSLWGLREIASESLLMRLLASKHNPVVLDIDSLSPEQAHLIAMQPEGKGIMLNNVRMISDEVAEKLGGSRASITLLSLKERSNEVDRALRRNPHIELPE